ncbi:MAG: glycosyltransferase [Alphaproteobacteria bacterium]|jgi:glycosyltransferase involved in cell wall biosynthesis|nr:glycosyltransferase [Alphaproteobacteria bacterium]MDP7222671.1 glycosyltransferase [Alphaproteobacteria bacterium]
MKVAIGLITYKRPNGLKTVLESICRLQVPSDVDLHVIIVSNEQSQETQEIVRNCENTHTDIHFHYDVEETVGIPFARNKTVTRAMEMKADALIYIDDDEICPKDWLTTMISFWQAHKDEADVFTGPVCPIFPEKGTPNWAKTSDFYNTIDRHDDGALIDRAYTNNTLVSARALNKAGPCFHSAFAQTGSSDLHYFQTLYIRHGLKIMWCNEAFLYETVPSSRLNLRWLAKRGFRSGAGDTISRLLVHDKSAKGIVKVITLSGGRLVSAFLLLLVGIITFNMARIVKGYRRFFSGVGGFAGLFGFNYNEYKTIHT